jgi:hypothetical protein
MRIRIKWNPGALLVGIISDTTTVENSLAIPLKVKDGITVMIQQFHYEVYTKGKESRDSNRCLHTNV